MGTRRLFTVFVVLLWCGIGTFCLCRAQDTQESPGALRDRVKAGRASQAGTGVDPADAAVRDPLEQRATTQEINKTLQQIEANPFLNGQQKEQLEEYLRRQAEKQGASPGASGAGSAMDAADASTMLEDFMQQQSFTDEQKEQVRPLFDSLQKNQPSAQNSSQSQGYNYMTEKEIMNSLLSNPVEYTPQQK